MDDKHVLSRDEREARRKEKMRERFAMLQARKKEKALLRREARELAREEARARGEHVPPPAIRKKEALPVQPLLAKDRYIAALLEHDGNATRARKASGLRLREVEEMLATDPEFREKHDEAFGGIVDEIEQVSVTMAKSGKDSGHTRWKLAKLKPDVYGEKPRTIEHKFSGSVTIPDTTAQILEILGADIDIAEIEGAK